jgi:glutamate formiminotransferase/formiminotetrahydrofolate cyclodeaminase
MNLTDTDVTGIADAFEAADSLARTRGLRVTGSEIVGLVPRDALEAAGRHFLERRGACRGVPRKEAIECAIRSLGLCDASPFDPAKKVLEARLERKGLADMTVDAFCALVSTDSPAPGGGSVAALSGALGAALASMVANLTHGKKEFEPVRHEMERIAMRAQELRLALLEAVERDTEAFNGVMAALRMPRRTVEETASRAEATRAATRGAAQVPLEVMRLGAEVLEIATVAVEKGSPGSMTDAGVAGLMARACVAGAHYNVLVNLGGLRDPDLARRMRDEAAGIRETVEERSSGMEAKLSKALA